jgi:hypothetical protein
MVKMKMDYTLESIAKFVRETYPNEPGEVSVVANVTTSPVFAYATFVQGEEGDEVEIQDVNILTYYGLPVSVKRTVILKKRQNYNVTNKPENLSFWK